MKMFKANLYKVFDENGNLVGEQILGSTLGKKEHLKVDGEIYYHKGIGFFGREAHYNNKAGRLMLKIDSVHQRIFYYGEKYTESIILNPRVGITVRFHCINLKTTNCW